MLPTEVGPIVKPYVSPDVAKKYQLTPTADFKKLNFIEINQIKSQVQTILHRIGGKTKSTDQAKLPLPMRTSIRCWIICIILIISPRV